jgi:hypothetical protein
MTFAKMTGSVLSLFLAALLLSAAGCSQKADDRQAKAKDVKSDGKKDITRADTKHDGWWCEEHGVPEDICSLCSDTAAAKFKKEGDWCKIHDRAQSQCFKCDPSKYKKFEDMYVAKYDKKPAPPPDDEFKK